MGLTFGNEPRWLKLSLYLSRGRVGTIVRVEGREGYVAHFAAATSNPGVVAEVGAYLEPVSLLRALSRAMAAVNPFMKPSVREAREKACDLMAQLFEEAGGFL